MARSTAVVLLTAWVLVAGVQGELRQGVAHACYDTLHARAVGVSRLDSWADFLQVPCDHAVPTLAPQRPPLG